MHTSGRQPAPSKLRTTGSASSSSRREPIPDQRMSGTAACPQHHRMPGSGPRAAKPQHHPRRQDAKNGCYCSAARPVLVNGVAFEGYTAVGAACRAFARPPSQTNGVHQRAPVSIETSARLVEQRCRSRPGCAKLQTLYKSTRITKTTSTVVAATPLQCRAAGDTIADGARVSVHGMLRMPRGLYGLCRCGYMYIYIYTD